MISAASLVLFFFLLFKWFDVFTHHGSFVEVPDLTGMSEEEATKELNKLGLVVETIDSLYDLPEDLKDEDIGFGDVIMQNPKANEKVKKGRRFYLMVRTSHPPMVKMPDLIDLSLRQAIAIIEARGLIFGKAIPKPGLPPVMRQLYKGSPIAPGTEIPKGSTIDVWVGSGTGDGEDVEVAIPNLVGKTRNEALKILGNYGLFPGAEMFDYNPRNSRDSSYGVVVKQLPGPNVEDKITQGSDLDIWYTRPTDDNN